MKKDIKISDGEMVEIMRAGMASRFWAELVVIMEENVKMLEEQILSKISLEPGHVGEVLTDEEIDRLRDKRSAMIELMSQPEMVIRSLIGEENGEEEDDLDPYRKTPVLTG